jgi:UPF0755 protein
MYSLGKKRSKKKTAMLVVAGVLLALLLFSGWFIRNTYTNNLKPVSQDVTQVVVTIEPGSSVHDVAVLLEQKGLIRNGWAFEWYVRSQNVREKLQAGSFSVSPSMSVQEIIKTIIEGKVATDLFTILPAKRLDQIQVAFNDAFTKSGFTIEKIASAFDPSLYAGHPALTDKPASASLEGYLYPETFQRTATTTPDTIIRASLDEMAKALSPEVRSGMAKQGLTIHEGVILASIVEKEVSNVEDKAKVAQVFLTRLKQGMMLGSDVTAYYGAEVAGLERSVFTDTPYNTRLRTGLPPGPISNVSRSSLQAVASPANTNYLYFVAGDDGITYFSKTLKEHEALTEAHCKELCKE